MHKIITSLIFSLPLLAYAELPKLMEKPNFWKEEKLESSQHVGGIILQPILYNKDLAKEAGVTTESIEKFADYYYQHIKNFYKDKNSTGVVTLLVKVTSNKKNAPPNTVCEANPTECSLTSVNFIFSEDMNPKEAKELYTFLNNHAQHDNHEIFISNFEFSSALHLLIEFDINHAPLQQNLQDLLQKQNASNPKKLNSRDVI